MLGVMVEADDLNEAIVAALTQFQRGVQAAAEGEHTIGLWISRSGLSLRHYDWDSVRGPRLAGLDMQ